VVAAESSDIRVAQDQPRGSGGCTFWIEAGIYTSEERLIDAELREFIARAKTIAAENG